MTRSSTWQQATWIDCLWLHDSGDNYLDIYRALSGTTHRRLGSASHSHVHLDSEDCSDTVLSHRPKFNSIPAPFAQQTVAHYETARLRVPASMLPHLAKIFGVGVDDLIGQPSKPASKRGPAPKLQRHMERLSLLPKPKQRAVMEVIEAVLAQQAR